MNKNGRMNSQTTLPGQWLHSAGHQSQRFLSLGVSVTAPVHIQDCSQQNFPSLITCHRQQCSFVRRRRGLPRAASFSTDGDGSPLKTIQTAMTKLKAFATELQTLADQVDRPHSITAFSTNRDGVIKATTTKSMSLAEIVLHSQDVTSMDEFHSPIAQTARQEFLEIAQQVEQRLQILAKEYVEQVQPAMEEATKICQETPCGGATWELDLNQLMRQKQQQQEEEEQQQQQMAWSTSKMTTRPATETITTATTHHLTLQGDLGTLDGTPCGRLQVSSLEFLQTTFETRPQMVMASRARVLLDLALEFNAPLQHIRRHGTSAQQQRMRTMSSQRPSSQAVVVATPWIRTDAEYQELQHVQANLVVRPKQ